MLRVLELLLVFGFLNWWLFWLFGFGGVRAPLLGARLRASELARGRAKGGELGLRGF